MLFLALLQHWRCSVFAGVAKEAPTHSCTFLPFFPAAVGLVFENILFLVNYQRRLCNLGSDLDAAILV